MVLFRDAGRKLKHKMRIVLELLIIIPHLDTSISQTTKFEAF